MNVKETITLFRITSSPITGKGQLTVVMLFLVPSSKPMETVPWIRSSL